MQRVSSRATGDAIDRVRLPAHRLLGGTLRSRVERGVDEQVAELLVAQDGVDHCPHRVEREGAVLARSPLGGRQSQRRRAGARREAVAQVVLAGHDGEHQVPPRDRAVGMAPRGVERRPTRERGERGALGDCEMVHALAEEVAARRLDAVGAVAQVDDVQVERENLLLGEGALEPPGQVDLDQLPPERALLGQARHERVAHDLHGDRAEAFAHGGGGDVPHQRAARAPPVHAVVIEETAVLDRDERGAHVPRHPVERHVDAAHVVQAAERGAVAVEHTPAFAGPERLDVGHGGTPGEAAGDRPGARGEREEQQQYERRQA